MGVPVGLNQQAQKPTPTASGEKFQKMAHSGSGCWVQAYGNRDAYDGKYDGNGVETWANGQSHGRAVHTCKDDI
ncbi:hypothetical protein LguiA_035754 [Lonicera macranthoides]